MQNRKKLRNMRPIMAQHPNSITMKQLHSTRISRIMKQQHSIRMSRTIQKQAKSNAGFVFYKCGRVECKKER